ncbi:MAG: glycosyltransferase [Patescibacteria group bacterium]
MAQAKQKIIIFITKSNWGGAQKYVFDIATNLPKDEYEVVVALGGKDTLYTRLIDAGIRVIELEGLQRDVSIMKDWNTFTKILGILKTEKPDIIHLNSSKISGIGALAGKLTGVKNIIFTVHGWAFNENRSFISKAVIKIVYLVMLWLSHNIIVVSNTTASQIKNWPFNKKKLTVIYNGIKTPNFLDRNIARKLLGERVNTNVTEDTILVGGIGEYHHIKGQTYGIQAMEKIAADRPTLAIKYIIIGNGDIEQQLRDEINSRGLQDRVFLTGYLQDGATYIKGLDYYLFPSLSEGLAYAAIEAGFAELPIIASNVGGLTEVIANEKEGILIPSQSPDAIVEALYRYIDNPKLADTFAHALHEKMLKDFTLDIMVSKTKAIYLK